MSASPVGLLLLTLLVPASALAQNPLRIDRTAERMRVDGSLREWRGARFSELDGGSVRYALATNEKGLFVAVEVQDERLVRRGAPGPKQDAVVLTFAMPSDAGKLRGTDIWLHPGDMGKSAAIAGKAGFRRKPKRDRKITVVEGPLKGREGYTLEALIPWRVVTGAQFWERGRGALRVVDVDSAAKPRPREVASANTLRLAELPRIALGEGQDDQLGSFLASQGLSGAQPRHDFRGNVNGDRRKERVVVVDNFVVVMGPGYRDGKAYGFMQLPVGIGSAVHGARLRDITGDGRQELLVTLRQQNQLGNRDLWTVVSMSGANPRVLWGVETRKQTRDGWVESKLRINKARRRGRPPVIVLTPGRAQGLSAANFRDGKAPGVAPILLPWGSVERRSYRFDGSAFAVVDEQVREAPAAPEAPVASAASSARRAPAASQAPQARRAPSARSLRAQFEQQLGLAGRTPRWTRRTDLAGDRKPETVHVYGNTLVMLGPGIGDGQRFITYTLPVPDPADILAIRCADVTGDGPEELMFRVRQRLSSGAGVPTVREVLLVHHFQPDGTFGRILAVEVAREQGGKRIENDVRLPHGKRGDPKGLWIRPGNARGWTKRNYPFTPEPTGGVGRLLLPWQDRAVGYRFDGRQLLPR